MAENDDELVEFAILPDSSVVPIVVANIVAPVTRPFDDVEIVVDKCAKSPR